MGCQDCATGLTSPTGATAASQCKACYKGSDCADGKMCDAVKNSCEAVFAGWVPIASGYGSTACPAGTYASGTCLDCQAGKYNDASGQTICQDCATGLTSPTGATAASQCAAAGAS